MKYRHKQMFNLFQESTHKIENQNFLRFFFYETFILNASLYEENKHDRSFQKESQNIFGPKLDLK